MLAAKNRHLTAVMVINDYICSMQDKSEQVVTALNEALVHFFCRKCQAYGN